MMAPVVKSLAELPAHVAGKFPRDAYVRRSVGNNVLARSSRALFDEVRDFSLGLEALGVGAGDRVAMCDARRSKTR